MQQSRDDGSDPAAAGFREPEDILRHAGLSPARKRELLEGWRQRHGAGGGAGADSGLLERIGRALALLDTESGGRVQTHEQVLHGPGAAGTAADPAPSSSSAGRSERG